MTEKVRLLHVEDDPLQHRLMDIRLRSVPGLAFDTTWVAREDEAIAAFERAPFDLVILDYMLAQGNGLHLLREFRTRDRVIPIIALSGVATAEIAAELIREGADDYFDKSEPDPTRFVQSIRTCLTRAARLRNRARSAAPTALSSHVTALSADFVTRLGPDFFANLDRVVIDLRAQTATLADLEALFTRLTLPTTARPLLLEIAARLFGDDLPDSPLRPG